MARVVTAWIRHGHYHQPEGVPSAHLPHPLTELGREQAVECAEELAKTIQEKGWIPEPVIDSSLMLRAWGTARILADELERHLGISFSIEEFEALAERGVGSAANLTVDEIAAIIARDPRYENLPEGWKSTSHFKLPLQGAESMMEAGIRVGNHIEERARSIASTASTASRHETGLEDETRREPLKIVVGHGGAFRHAAVHLGTLELEAVPGLSMWHCSPVFMAWSPESGWTHAGGYWKVRQKVEKPD